MKFKILGSPKDGDKDSQYGDCIILYDHISATIFDCGSIEHAERVIKLLNSENIKDAHIIVSHIDSDHLDGVNRLCNEQSIIVSGIYTIDPRDYGRLIYQEVNSDEKISTFNNLMKKMYSNLCTLNQSKLRDIYNHKDEIPFVEMCGPSKKFLISELSKLFDINETDTSHSTTIVNEVSIICKAKLPDNKYLLLTGDCTFEALEPYLSDQIEVLILPHHGNFEIAEKIFAYYDNKHKNDIIYVVSDNTGDTNGGSDKLQKEHIGHRVLFTCHEGDITDDMLLLDRKDSTYGSINILKDSKR